MPGSLKPFRYRRCIALIVAFLVWTIVLQTQAVGQSDDASATADEQTKKLSVIFSPVEIVPIRVSSKPADSPTSPDTPSRGDAIERKSLARIFASGMIIDHKAPLPSRNESPDLLLGAKNFASEPAMSVARAPQQLATVSNAREQISPQQRPQQNKVVNPDALPEASVLPHWELLQGMIQDNNVKPVIIDKLPGTAEPRLEIPQPEPGLRQFPSYTMPDGGLDIYLLAPTRFSRPLPNAP
ncbi:MAG TPA: hypothetical protein DDZ51_30990 [Planctomycetaceae bacterium]|nr:hypothetical protein [Planctomycetaceae bacterium]